MRLSAAALLVVICCAPMQASAGRQVGDQLDRGDSELQVLYFLERLAREAQASIVCTIL